MFPVKARDPLVDMHYFDWFKLIASLLLIVPSWLDPLVLILRVTRQLCEDADRCAHRASTVHDTICGST